jgi:hypothetical protein
VFVDGAPGPRTLDPPEPALAWPVAMSA